LCRESATPGAAWKPDPSRGDMSGVSYQDTSRTGVAGFDIGAELEIGDWEPSWTKDAYAAAIGEVRAAIARGDVYQVNLVQHLCPEWEGDPAPLAGALAPLRPLHPEPLAGDGWSIVSASPELFLRRRGRRVTTMPIKGTRPLGERGLGTAEKDRAEHVMIVD